MTIFIIWIILEVFARFIWKYLKKSNFFVRMRIFIGNFGANATARRQGVSYTSPLPKENVIILGPGTAVVKYAPPPPMVNYIAPKTALVPYNYKYARTIFRGKK